MRSMRLIIKNGRLLDPATGVDGVYDILIDNGMIGEIAENIEPGTGDDRLDATGLVVCPGFIDIHVHLREPGQEHKETIATGCASAVRGGFTTVACMPNTTPVNDNRETTEFIIKQARETNLLNVLSVAAISKGLAGKQMVDMKNLYDAGARGFTDDGRCVMDDELFRKALEMSRELGVPVMEHPEDHDQSGSGQLNEGEVSRLLGLKGIPAAAEDDIVGRDIEIQTEVKGKLHLTHLSTAGAMALVKKAKEKGILVTSDVTPHHLLLTEDLIAQTKGGVYKMKPPLRTEADRQAMVEGIRTGVIDCIATDHAPHSPEEKNREFEKAPFGVIGMETSFPVIYDRFVRTGVIDLKHMVELFSTNPAKIMGLSDRGVVKPGVPADLTILDLERPFKIDAADFKSKSSNCPFIGWEGKGAIAYTIVKGKVVYGLC